MPFGYQLPAGAGPFQNQAATGFTTPQQDQAPQVATVLPRRVIPIIFLPGVMGSNLYVTSKERLALLHQTDNNKAWHPDDFGSHPFDASNVPTRDRQLRLDPMTTAVDVYDPKGGDVSGDGRASQVQLDKNFASPLVANDVPGTTHGQTGDQRARMRGWGEVHFKSYSIVLQRLEQCLNSSFVNGKVSTNWQSIVGVDPNKWQAYPPGSLPPLTQAQLKTFATGRWYPVHAIGYNWLASNSESGKAVAKRIEAVIQLYADAKYDCDKVILVTHSMGGLVARAIVHPSFGNLQDKVLGTVHSVMPATGAGTAYKRIRTGFDDPGLLSMSIEASVVAKIAGNKGSEVTGVLANSPGGIQLLPTARYGNGWLKITQNGKVLKAWPEKGDPYSEIYSVMGKWYSLFQENWINPSHLDSDHGGGTSERTLRYVENARQFHQVIGDFYHPCSYAHYGADPHHLCFGDVVWDIAHDCKTPQDWDAWTAYQDNEQGKLQLGLPKASAAAPPPHTFEVKLLPATESGDETVPMRSADDQLRHRPPFKGIFRQSGYDHQSSYKSEEVLQATLYSIAQIVIHNDKAVA